MKKVCIISHETVGLQMAGPSIRFYQLAQTLGKKFDVTLAVPKNEGILEESFKIFVYDVSNLEDFIQQFDIVYVFGLLLRLFPFLKEVPGSLVVDIYCPTFFEALANPGQYRHEDLASRSRMLVDIFQEQLGVGDYFICASEKQRDMWMGMLMGSQRINPITFNQDKTFRSLIDVVSYGVPEIAPVKKNNVMKGVHPFIKETDFVVLWGGGLYEWLDPFTAIKAMAIVQQKREDVKLFFMGCRNPNPTVSANSYDEARELSNSLGLTGKSVLFNEHWVDYNDRGDYLLEADIGLNLHQQTIETDYSFRTRIMDYIWAGLPIITTQGGSLSDLTEEKNLGMVVDYYNAEEISQKILQLVENPELRKQYSESCQNLVPEFYWHRVAEPLARFCESPTKNLDEAFIVQWWKITNPVAIFKKLRSFYRQKGYLGVLAKISIYLLHKLQILIAKALAHLIHFYNK